MAWSDFVYNAFIFTFPLRLNEHLHLKCPSYLHEQTDLSHAHIHAIWADQRQQHP